MQTSCVTDLGSRSATFHLNTCIFQVTFLVCFKHTYILTYHSRKTNNVGGDCKKMISNMLAGTTASPEESLFSPF